MYLFIHSFIIFIYLFTHLIAQVAILRQAHAENVVRFLGVCIQNDSILLVTEYMAGGDLFHALAEPQSRAALLWHRM